MYQKRNNELEVISLYKGNYKSRFYLRQISNMLEMPLKTAQNTLANLEKLKILKSTTEGKNKYFSLNLENINTKFYLIRSEIYKTSSLLEKYPQFKIFLKSIETNAPLIVFGSFARFSANKNSDLDILIIQNKETELPFHLVPFQPHEVKMTEETFLKAMKEQEDLIKEIEENHIILNNHSFFVNVFWREYAR